MISVLEASNSNVELAVRVSVRFVSRSKRAEMAVRAVVSRSSKSTKRPGMARRDLRVERVDNISVKRVGIFYRSNEGDGFILDFRISILDWCREGFFTTDVRGGGRES